MALAVFSRCALPAPSSAGSAAYATSSDQIILLWDPPGGPSSGPLAVAGYYVYYRPYGSAAWRLLKHVEASENPTVTVYHREVGNGAWEFGVTAVDVAGWNSAIHSSADDTARPFGGWHLIWKRTDQ